MYFYHCTSQSGALNFQRMGGKKRKLKRIRPSEFYYQACLQDWLNRLVLFKDNVNISSNDFLKRLVSYSFDGGSKHVFWLGTGFYCFSEEYIEQSIDYAVKSETKDSIVQITYSDECSSFDMEENKDNIIDFLERDVIEYIKLSEQLSDIELEAFQFLVQLLLVEIQDEYYGNPHVAGMILELYLAQKELNFDYVVNNFLIDQEELLYSNYVAIKNLDLISHIEYSVDLSRRVKGIKSNTSS